MGCFNSTLKGAPPELVTTPEEEPVQTQPPVVVSRSKSWASNLASSQKPRLLDIVRDGSGTPSDVWLQANFDVQLQKLLEEHPYLDVNGSAQPHPLRTWLCKVRESSDGKRFRLAHEQLHRVLVGLEAEKRPILEAFRRFDLDGSGHIDADEFQQMCAYLGWGEEDVSLMDLDQDGRVTLRDFQAFVGHMGGVHQLFEKRRLRITTSRKDVCDYAGIAVGALVRSYFYVRGQKSTSWKEARVVAVGVERGNPGEGPSTLGVVLEFGFGPAERWKTRQVVPTNWVLGGVEDASVAAVMREVGILDEQQCFWALLLPDSEMHAMRHLTEHQKAALKLCRETATTSHEQKLEVCRQRFKELDYGEKELQAVLGWVQDLAPIVIHCGIDDTGRFLETDEFYRSQFETKTGKGAGEDYETNKVRHGWENRLFGGHYDEAKPFERVKYGALNVMNDFRGVVSALRYGDSYLVLKDVRLRCTFTVGDSAGRSVNDMAVLDRYAHVLADYSDAEIRGLVGVATGAIASEREGGLQTSGPAQPKLLRGTSEDPTSDWVTYGFPGLKQRSGCYYFEVHLSEGCCTPQVGVLSSKFQQMPFLASAQGVGDDYDGWAVDGQNAARWHGSMRPWATSWPSKAASTAPKAPSPWGGPVSIQGTSKTRVLCKAVVVGVAVDLECRQLWFSSDGVWDEEPTFGEADLPLGTVLFPAVSLKGRAAFIFGPSEYKHAPPQGRGSFLQWPGTPGGKVRIDSPDLGNSQILSVYKEVQIHGEVNLKRNVQRLVANNKYRIKPKMERSFALIVSNAGPCSGTYHRVGAREGRPLYKSDAGAALFWDSKAELWKMSETLDLAAFFCHAPVDSKKPEEPPRTGWKLPDEARGIVKKGAFLSALTDAEVGKEDIDRLLAALTPKDGSFTYRVRGETSLEKEWQKLQDPPATHDAVWAAAIKKVQMEVLAEANLSIGEVVETQHPYAAKRYSWTKEVQIANTSALSVYFASKTCTLDRRARLTISAGGLNKSTMGPGVRVEVSGPAGNKVTGSLVERLEGGQNILVQLDRPEAKQPLTTEDTATWEPQAGDAIEALDAGGGWSPGKIAEVLYTVDWYEGTKQPSGYLVVWEDASPVTCERARDQLRLPLLGNDAFPTYGLVPPGSEPCYAVCSEAAKAAIVKFAGSTVGSEIASFKLDESYPMAPFTIASFAGNGPAQEQGVSEGWYLDLAASVLGESKKEFAELLSGIGGVVPMPDSAAPKEGRFNPKFLNRLLGAAFNNLQQVIARLNDGLLGMSEVSLVFFSAQQAKMLPEAHVRYAGDQRVGSEVRQFTSQAAAVPPAGFGPPFGMVGVAGSPKGVRPEGFLKMGPAQAAGVRTDWILDIGKTSELNPGKEDMLKEDVLFENANILLSMSDVTMVFKQPNTDKVPMFVGAGAADSEKWKCCDLPGDSACFVFSSDGDGINDPDRRWGVWSLVLPEGAPRMSTQAVDALANSWVEVSAKATGIQNEPTCERDEWDEARLRALCERHGWEFSWMTEDGERRLRAGERQGFFNASGQLAGARDAATAAAAVQADRKQQAVSAMAEAAPASVPAGAVDAPGEEAGA